MLKTLIVEDEYPARQELRFLLEPYRNNLEIIGEAESVREAKALIDAINYDVIFLDVQMPGSNGLDLARDLKVTHPEIEIVLISAFENYAVDAFAIPVMDYLLKPVSPDRIAETMRRLLPTVSSERRTADMVLSWIPCEANGHTMPIAVSEVIYIVAERETIYVVTSNDRYPTRFTLQELQDRLPGDQFLRTHRSFIANVMQVKELMPHFNGTYLLKMKDRQHSEVIVSRSNVKRIKEIFNMA